MATQKYSITDPDGSKARARAARGSKKALTDPGGEEARAKAAREVDERARARLQERLQAVGTQTTTALGSVGGSVFNGQSSNTRTRERKTHDAYGGLTLPVFDPSQHLANDLFTDSSGLSRTTKAEADSLIESVEEKRQTIRVVAANLDLNTDILKAGTKSQKMNQSAIDFGISNINTDTKLIDFDSALTSNEIAGVKLEQNQEKLSHEQVTLEGLRNETDQRRRFWQEKYELGESRIRSVQLARYQLDLKIGSIDTEATNIVD
ncbi:MAG: hypothetical protein HWQ41_00590 [Nostoc sp. NOS(2021)]|uniref:hypothetical protein n=1 Tax=Nostoc sp. NOS(2021) TaxID=2815407 RepID=UPI0025FDC3A6|nr:hypothetical protein [Nostoc sp. NOS(2021)]MBN3893840.1 hypothetical protein [Nostoc sp. NOS(2021)]